MRLTPDLTIAARQELHRALWSMYLRLEKDMTDGPQSILSALDALRSLWWSAVPWALPVVGTALWDLLETYAKKRPPANFTALLDEMLGLKLARARQLRREPLHADFPPFARPMICDSSFAVTRNGSQVNLSVCVESDFDDLSALAEPEEWPRLCPLFWADVKRSGQGWDGQWHAPLMGGVKPLEARLVENARVADKTQAMADIRLIPEGQFGEARLLFVMQPEQQKPGWTRVTHTREVAFGPQVPSAFRYGTSLYWTKSEIACLVLQ
jgi:hypothetical protein